MRCRNADWNKPGFPSRSKYGTQCFNPLLRSDLWRGRCTGRWRMQCTHRWSKPIGSVKSFHVSWVSKAMAPIKKSSWTNDLSLALWHVQLSWAQSLCFIRLNICIPCSNIHSINNEPLLFLVPHPHVPHEAKSSCGSICQGLDSPAPPFSATPLIGLLGLTRCPFSIAKTRPTPPPSSNTFTGVQLPSHRCRQSQKHSNNSNITASTLPPGRNWQQAELPPRTLDPTKHIQPSVKDGNGMPPSHPTTASAKNSATISTPPAKPCWIPSPDRTPAVRSPRSPLAQTQHTNRISSESCSWDASVSPYLCQLAAVGAVAFSIPWATTVQLVPRQGYSDPEESHSKKQPPESAAKQAPAWLPTHGSLT